MPESPGTSVRISAATPLADLAAVVWPGVTTVYHPRTDSAAQVHALDQRITHLERWRGIRPGTVRIIPLVETPRGVCMAHDIAASSARIRAFGSGPNLSVGLGLEPDADSQPADALLYARSECELQARALGLQPVAIREVLD